MAVHLTAAAARRPRTPAPRPEQASRADAVLEAAGSAPTETRQGYPAGLTEREIEVLRLLAQGKTNREIAEALVITEKTAGHHVEHIYAKADVSTRVGAALFAMRHDLVE